ncbi:LysR family transcriptional regulator [Breoghania sp.]|uniref:LysR family transcriptional regulator n=1 Tax=Breoghania sp. TaxID=2065378 RepID=UPI00261E89DE|nr:LysR family transcriptional regulator [Breoghania sp.]MDJ0932227.1 LysR family transcriptional regulator [Breoghania sp.]
MWLLQLKSFQVIITRAAEVLHIAQPSLSKTIAELEQNLGVPLFDRNGRRIKLNRFGHAFLRRVRSVFGEIDQARQELKDMANENSGHVTVGVTKSQILPNLFEDYLAKYRDIKFKLFQVFGLHKIAHQLRDGEFDFCISSLPIRISPGERRSPYRNF